MLQPRNAATKRRNTNYGNISSHGNIYIIFVVAQLIVAFSQSVEVAAQFIGRYQHHTNIAAPSETSFPEFGEPSWKRRNLNCHCLANYVLDFFSYSVYYYYFMFSISRIV